MEVFTARIGMCFSSEASLGVAAGLLPAGAYCIDAAWRKDRNYLPLAIVPIVFGLQQLCEGLVWVGINQKHPEMIRMAALAYLGIALALWPVWIPVALGALDSRKEYRLGLTILAGIGVLFGLVFYLPLATASGRGINPTVIGHSIRYDLSAVPAFNSLWWWLGMAVYLIAVSAPMFISRNLQLRPLGAGVILAALISYLLFEYAFSSVWCFFAAILSLYLVRVFYYLPARESETHESHLHPMPSNQ